MKDRIYALIRFLWYEPVILYLYVFHRLSGIYPESASKLKPISELELQTSLAQGKSLIRIGDGEAMLLVGSSIHFQPFTNRIRQGLLGIVKDYSSASPYILAIPHFAVLESEESLRARHRQNIWRLFRIVFRLKCTKEVPYADAILFYHKDTFSNYVLPILKDKHVIIVSSAKNETIALKTYLNANHLSHTFITSPVTNAFAYTEQLDEKISAILQKYPHAIIIFAIGPAGKILAYDFSHRGTQCIDLGHGIEIIGKEADYASRL